MGDAEPLSFGDSADSDEEVLEDQADSDDEADRLPTPAVTPPNLLDELGEYVALHLPLLHRVRSTLISKTWADLLKKPHFWANIDFEGGRAEMINDGLLLKLCRLTLVKEGGLGTTLTSIDVTADACRHITMQHQGQSLLTALAEILDSSGKSLTCVLKSLKVGDKIVIRTVAQATQLIADCPLLTHIGLTVNCGTWPNTLAALSQLNHAIVNGRAVKRVVDRVILCPTWATGQAGGENPNVGIIAFANALGPALEACSVLTMHFDGGSQGSWVDAYNHSHTADPAAAVAAAARLGALLADPANGPHTVSFACGSGRAPSTPRFVADLLLRLTPESPLQTLSIPDGDGPKPQPGDGSEWPVVTEALCRALVGPAKLRLDTLDIGGDCVRHLLLTTLAEGNTTLRSVTLRSSSKLRPQALVNAVQLTPTLREMKLVGELFDLEMGAFVKFVEGAVDPPQEGRGDASASASAGGSGGGGGSTSGGGGGPNRLDSLELSNMEMNKLAWGALVSSIAQGARLERLAIRNIPFQPPPGANAGNEMATCLGASLARMQAAEDRARVHLRELTLESCGVHDDGAKRLAEALGAGFPFRVLSLRGSAITATGGVAIAQAIGAVAAAEAWAAKLSSRYCKVPLRLESLRFDRQHRSVRESCAAVARHRVCKHCEHAARGCPPLVIDMRMSYEF